MPISLALPGLGATITSVSNDARIEVGFGCNVEQFLKLHPHDDYSILVKSPSGKFLLNEVSFEMRPDDSLIIITAKTTYSL